MADLRAGLIGVGLMGRNHARILRSLDGVRLLAVMDPMGDRHRAAEGALVLTQLEEFLALPLDYAVVSVPTAEHLAIGMALAEAGIPTLVEKPLAGNLADARALAEAFDSRGLIAAVGHIERYNAALQNLRLRLQNGDLGELYQITTRRQGPFPPRIGDVGVVMDLATHDVDLTAWISGASYLSLSARTARKSGREHEDLVAVVASLSDGTLASHLVSWLSPMKERQTVVIGERGAFVADTLTADLTFYANGSVLMEWDAIATFRGVTEGDVTRFAFPKPEPLRREHEAFRDCFLGVRSDVVTMSQALNTVAVTEAILQSAHTGSTVEPQHGLQATEGAG